MKQHRWIFLMVLCAVVLTACGGEEAKQAAVDVKAAAAPKAPAKGKAKAATKQADNDPPPVLVVPEGYRYEQRGRRDPFVNPTPKPVAAAPEVPTIRPDGLRGLLVGEAKVVAIVKSSEPGMTKVMLTAPGKKTFIAAQGDLLFDAVIKEIRTDSVVFTMVSPTTRQPVKETTVRTGESGGTLAGDKK